MATKFSIRTWAPRWVREIEAELDQAFDQMYSGKNGSNAEPAHCRWTPAVDLYDRPDDVVVELDLPGIDRSTLDLTVQHGILTVKAERKANAAEKGKCAYAERPMGSFYRAIELPESIASDKVEATYQDGVLKVVLTKVAEARPRKIAISTPPPALSEPAGN